MDQFVIEAKTRKETGKKVAKQLRAAGRIPAVVYNEKGESTPVDVDTVEFNKAWRNITKTTLVTLKVDGKAEDAFIADTEYDIKTDSVLHADFFAVTNTKPVVRKYKVQYTGTAAGVLKGGFMVKHVPEVVVKALPKDLPARLVVDVSKVNIGDVLRVGDLELGKNVTIITDEKAALVTVAPAR